MAEKKFKGAPFGTQTARFDVSGVHPARKKTGTYIEIPYCKRMTSDLEQNLGPGTYDVNRDGFSAHAVAERAKGPGWHQAFVTEKKAQRPQRQACTHKQFLKTKVGPGTYESTDFIQELAKKPGSFHGVCGSTGPRFRVVQSYTPGPGSYGKQGVPWAALEKKRAQLAGCLKMEHSIRRKQLPGADSTKHFLCIQDSGLSPCAYNLRDSIDIMLNKRVSKRGPYDLFTGCWDKPMMSGHFATSRHVSPNPGDYKIDSFVDMLNRRERKKHGVFGMLAQYPSTPTERIYHSSLAQCLHPPNSPAPEVVALARPVNHKPPPFLSSAPRQTKQQERQLIGNFRTIGPASYNVEVKDQKKYLRGPTSSFKTGTLRYPSQPERDNMLQ
ncbi:lymphocyte expansion molecule-like [Lampris incognitus]|uniref:lymphocyte expansion molecule-like n=1 Tax=Lampris incognitus TaxID=2546036 RepID=UPI0024B5CCA1|nr:lymphocyte expansion molecule-like [Lampris incognitus]